MDEQEKQLIRNVQSHDLAESLRLRRAVHAKTQGLPPESFALPFPANQVTIQRTSDGGQWWKIPLGIAGGIGAASLSIVAGSLLWLAANRQTIPPSSTVEPPKQPATLPSPGWQWQIEYKDKDGTWKPVGDPVRLQEEMK